MSISDHTGTENARASAGSSGDKIRCARSAVLCASVVKSHRQLKWTAFRSGGPGTGSDRVRAITFEFYQKPKLLSLVHGSANHPVATAPRVLSFISASHGHGVNLQQRDETGALHPLLDRFHIAAAGFVP